MVPSARLHILLDYRPALRQRTGVGEFVHHLALALLRRPDGDAVTLFSSSWKDRLAPDAVPGARVVDARIPVSLLNLAWHRLEWPPVESLGARADVVWSLHPLLMPSRRAAQVVSVHDLYFLDHPEATAREVRRDYAALASDHVRRADAVITISEHTRQRAAARFGIPLDRITVCYPGAPAWTRRPAPAPRGPILHIGTIEPRKNVGALISAYAALVRTDTTAPPLVFAGRGTAPLEGTGLGPDRVKFLGYVSDEERLRLYREASMLVIASSDEGFGIPALEAMTIGLPVVSSNRGSLPEVVGDAALQVDPDDAEGFAGAMQRILEAPALAARLADAGVERSRLFSWETAADRLVEAFRSAVVARRSRR